MKRKLLNYVGMVTFLLIFLSQIANSQSRLISLNLKNVRLSEAVKQVSKQAGLLFFYNTEELDKNALVNINIKNQSLTAVLTQLLNNTDIQYLVDKNVVIFKTKVSQQPTPTIERKKVRISGKVSDNQGGIIPGVTIEELTTANRTQTDQNGNYILLVEPGAKIRFSYIGMIDYVLDTKTTASSTAQVNNVRLDEDVKTLNNVVVTGYQNIRATDYTGAIAKVNADDIKVAGINTLDDLLQGQIAGVAVTKPSGLVGQKPKTRIRGESTLLGSGEPIWVIDGIVQTAPLPFDQTVLQQTLTNQPSDQNGLDAIRSFVGSTIGPLNVEDVQDITVLKDASATAIYGVRAANGVIVITTKKGSVGATRINYSNNFTFAARPRYTDFNLMNSKERVDVSREIYERGLISSVTLDPIGYEGVLRQFLNKEITQSEFNAAVNRLETNNTDWFSLLFQNSISQTHNINLSGGSEKSTFYASLGAYDQQGASIGNSQQRYTGNLRLNSNLSKKLAVDMRLSASTSVTNGYYGVDNPFEYAFKTSRLLPAYNDDGSFYKYSSINSGRAFQYNQLFELSQTGNKNKNNNVSLNLGLDYKILKDLQFRSLFGYSLSQINGESFATERSLVATRIRNYEYGAVAANSTAYRGSRLPNGGLFSSTANATSNYLWRNTIDFNKQLRNEKDRLLLSIGSEIRSDRYEGLAATRYGYLPEFGRKFADVPARIYVGTVGGVDQFSDNNLVGTASQSSITDRKLNYLSFFATAAYNLDGKYVWNGSIRSDASNRFGQNEKYRFLPVYSGGFKWNMANESWFDRTYWLNQFSPRISYGLQGNVVEGYSPDLIAAIPTAPINATTGELFLNVRSLAYANLRWERTRTINLGLDLALFNNKIIGSFEYYNKKGTDIIVNRQIPSEYGIDLMPINGGNVLNSGYELSISFAPVRTNNWLWSLNFNTARNYNKVTNPGTTSYRGEWQRLAAGSLYKEGYPVSGFWAFDFNGLNPNTGIPTFNGLDVNDPVKVNDVSQAMVFVGQRDPKFNGGINSSLRYKKLTLGLLFVGATGNKQFLPALFDGRFSVPYPHQNLSSELVNRWRAPGDELFTQIPSLPQGGGLVGNVAIPGGSTANNPYTLYNLSTARVVDASYVRLQNLSLAYRLEDATPLKKLGLKQLNIQGSVYNVFYIASKKLMGIDPATTGNSLPIPRTFSLGLSAGF